MVWLDKAHRDLVIDVVKTSGARVSAIGSADPVISKDFCERFNAERIADFRVAARREGNGAVLLAISADSLPAETGLLLTADVQAISIEPFPDSLASASAVSDEGNTVQLAPLMRRTPGYRSAAEVISTFGEPRCVNVFFRCGKGQGSMFARLYDAMDIIRSLCGEPEQIDAALAGPVPGLPGVPESLRGLHGSITVNMRFSQNRCACIAVSDQAGAWFRGVTVLGERGCLRIHDDGFEWIDEDGARVDSSLASQPLTYADLVADQLVRLLQRRDPGELPLEHGRLLALCETARLSCRTGQSETPRKMLELLSRV